MALIYGELTRILRKCFYEVHNEIGPGFDEETYHKGLIFCFKKMTIPFVSKEKKVLQHRGSDIRSFELDLIAFDKIILELKCLQSKFLQSNYVQIISQLKLWKKSLGLLVNFGLQSVNVERVPFTEKKGTFVENYDYIKNLLIPEDRKHLAKLREAIIDVFKIQGLGYGESVYKKILETELAFKKINYEIGVKIKPKFEGNFIKEFKMKFPLIENRIVCCITALKEKVDAYDIARMQTYLNALGIHIGLIVNFGRTQLEIRGVRG